MRLNALYHVIEHEEGRITHAIDHDNGGFSVSSEKVGIAIQNFLNNATALDISIVHSHLLHAYRRQWEKEVNDEN